jgi:hypothetical protein
VRKLAVAVGCCVLIAGCRWQDVNEALPYPIRHRDAAHAIAAKSIGNAVVITVGAAVYLAWFAAWAYLESEAARNGVR